MFRKLLVWLMPMTLIATFLITYQWSMYQEEGAASADQANGNPSMYLEVVHDDGVLQVNQKINGLAKEQYIVRYPNKVKDITCVYGEGKPCLTEQAEQGMTVTIGYKEQIHLSYKLPINESDMVLKNWYAKLYTDQGDSMIVVDAKVDWTDKNESNLWAAAGDQQADIQKDYIRFYQWEKSTATSFPIIKLHNGEYHRQDMKGATVWAKKGVTSKEEVKKNFGENISFSVPVVTVVNPDIPSPEIGAGYILLPSLSEVNIQESLLSSMLQQQYPISSKGGAAIINGLVQFILSGNDVSAEASKLAEQLTISLTESQQEAFKEQLLTINKKQQGSAIALDHLLAEISGMPTSFFQLTTKEGRVQPLYFVDPRSVNVQAKQTTIDWHSISYKQQRWYPLAGITSAFDYELVALPNQSTYVVQKGGETWRFTLNKDTFVHNQEDFGVASHVLEELNGEIFIQEQYVEDIFGVSTGISQHSISLKQ
ncbi:hypothetical protein ACFFGV_10655 [Pontibacillus salicampi]|uniref:Copper amine oxidase-like N-terminal domain-containing protein n=1 Tax=Pontibacillus salicampi TaxID=1449801 RepID=A0ABV6LNN4_9BACI